VNGEATPQNSNLDTVNCMAYGGVDVKIQAFSTSALVGGGWSDSRQGRFSPGESAHGTYWIGGWVGPRTGLDEV
jgi:hypothetical protein